MTTIEFYSLDSDFAVHDLYAESEVLPGTFVGKYCESCGVARQTRCYPLEIEWVADRSSPGSTDVSDFIWPGHVNPIVVVQRVKDAIEGRASGHAFSPVTVRQVTRSAKRIPSPTAVPPLWEIIITGRAHMDVEASGRRIKTQCAVCDRVYYEVVDMRAQFIVPRGTWDGAEFFLIDEMGLRPFVTASAKELLEQAGYSNLKIEQCGQIQ